MLQLFLQSILIRYTNDWFSSWLYGWVVFQSGYKVLGLMFGGGFVGFLFFGVFVGEFMFKICKAGLKIYFLEDQPNQVGVKLVIRATYSQRVNHSMYNLTVTQPPLNNQLKNRSSCINYSETLFLDNPTVNPVK